MEPRVAALEEELEQRRERYNTAFAMARRARPRLDGEYFFHNLRTLVAPILSALPKAQAKLLVEPLYDLCLELTGIDLFRRSDAVTEVWTRLLPQAGRELAQEPRWLPAVLTNAAYNLEREESAQTDAWLTKMERCREACGTAKVWMGAGQVAAWLFGMAHLRESAIALGESLPRALRLTLYADWDKAVADPWYPLREADRSPHVVRRVGAFQGFGGCFRQPPWVAYAGDDRFLVEDGTESWVLSCDAFGATLKLGASEMEDNARDELKAQPDGTIVWGEMKPFCLDEIASVRSSASSPHILAVTSALSHHVFLVLGPRAT